VLWRGIQAKVSEPKKEKNTGEGVALLQHQCERRKKNRSRRRATTQKKYDNKPGNGECLAVGRQGVSLHPHLLKDSCVALLKCVKTMSYTDYGDDRATMLNVSSVCSENARWHGAAWARWACQTSTLPMYGHTGIHWDSGLPLGVSTTTERFSGMCCSSQTICY
jgi:hypothetical protein